MMHHMDTMWTPSTSLNLSKRSIHGPDTFLELMEELYKPSRSLHVLQAVLA